jgi:hypothetical protein
MVHRLRATVPGLEFLSQDFFSFQIKRPRVPCSRSATHSSLLLLLSLSPSPPTPAPAPPTPLSLLLTFAQSLTHPSISVSPSLSFGLWSH